MGILSFPVFKNHFINYSNIGWVTVFMIFDFGLRHMTEVIEFDAENPKLRIVFIPGNPGTWDA